MLKQVFGLALVAACAEAFAFAPATSFVGSKNVAMAKNGARAALRSPATATSMALAGKAPVQPAKEIKLHVYDHCPFCVRARIIFGLKNVKYTLNFLANDDVPTPTNLVGKKMAPILEIPAEGFAMPESMDIVKKIDEDPSLGPSVLQPASARTDIKDWQKRHKATFGQLQRPRYVMTGLLPEFAFESARDFFIKGHQMPGYEKADWKSDAYTMEFRKAEYQKAYAETATHLINANAALMELEPMIHAPEHCSPHGLSYDDIDLFARLRSITIVKGLIIPPKVQAYLDYFEKTADIPLWYAMAL